MKNKTKVSLLFVIGIIVAISSLVFATMAIIRFGNVYNVYTSTPLLFLFVSVILVVYGSDDMGAEYENNIKLKDLMGHDYYASESNYYSSEAVGRYSTWADFYDEFKNADIDMNLVFRWDVLSCDEEYYMLVIIIHQRTGIYMPIYIDSVEEKDVDSIIRFMKPHWEKLKRIWLPISDLDS